MEREWAPVQEPFEGTLYGKAKGHPPGTLRTQTRVEQPAGHISLMFKYPLASSGSRKPRGDSSSAQSQLSGVDEMVLLGPPDHQKLSRVVVLMGVKFSRMSWYNFNNEGK